MIAESQRLLGRTVLVTRPFHQAGPFMQLIERHGGKAIAFPTLEIQALTAAELPANVLEIFKQSQLIIFTSANAVTFAEALLHSLKSDLHALKCPLAAIGKATTKQLESRGLRVKLQPQSGFDSEALLMHPELQSRQIENNRILLVKGVGGRDKLSTSLKQRGAIVDSLDVYKRLIPEKDMGINRQQLSEEWSKLDIDVITVTSNESLQNLHDLLPAKVLPQLLDTPLVVPSQRAEALACKLGFRLVYTSISAHDRDMLEAVISSSKS